MSMTASRALRLSLLNRDISRAAIVSVERTITIRAVAV